LQIDELEVSGVGFQVSGVREEKQERHGALYPNYWQLTTDYLHFRHLISLPKARGFGKGI
jgi:hypothetical protein